MKKMDLRCHIAFGIGFSTFIVSSEEVWSMPQEELPSKRAVSCSQQVPSFDLDNATIDERFEHFFGLINTEIKTHQKDSKTLVPLYRQALDLAAQYGNDGSQLALNQTPILQSTLAFKLHESTEHLPLSNRIDSLRESCLLLRASCDDEDSDAKKNYGMALLEKSMLVDQLMDENPNMPLPECGQFQKEIIRDLEESKKHLPATTEEIPTLNTLLGLTLFKHAFSHRNDTDNALVKSYSLRAREIFNEALGLPFENEELRKTITGNLGSVNDFLRVKYGI